MTAPAAYTVVLSAAVERAIQRDLPETVARAVADLCFGALTRDPHRVGRPARLQPAGLWSAGRGQYRVIYSTSIVAVQAWLATARPNCRRRCPEA